MHLSGTRRPRAENRVTGGKGAPAAGSPAAGARLIGKGYLAAIFTVAAALETGAMGIRFSSWPMSKRSSATDMALPPRSTTAVT